MTTTQSAIDTDYLTKLAEDYGLVVHSEPEPSPALRFDLASRHRRTVISLSRLDDAWHWDVYPLGATKCDRRGHGRAADFGDALGDAEAMLRHFLRSIGMTKVMEVFGDDIFERARLANGPASTFARIVARGKAGSVCVADGEDN